MASWDRDASGCISLTNVIGNVALDIAPSQTMTFGLWVVIVDSVAYPGSRDFSMVTVSIDSQYLIQKVKHNKFSHLSFGHGVAITFTATNENNQLHLYGNTQEAVNYTIYRFWSNLSYEATTGVTSGEYGSATTVPQVLVDSYGRLVNVQDILITPDWVNITGKPTTVALSGLVDALSTSSLIDCGSF